MYSNLQLLEGTCIYKSLLFLPSCTTRHPRCWGEIGKAQLALTPPLGQKYFVTDNRNCPSLMPNDDVHPCQIGYRIAVPGLIENVSVLEFFSRHTEQTAVELSSINH